MSKLVFLLSSIICFNFVMAQEPQNIANANNDIFRMNLEEEPNSIHPILWSDAYGYEVVNMTCDSLLSRDNQTSEWKPRLAEKWEVSADKKQITFTLRENIKFHNGQPITVQDILFTFEAFASDKMGGNRWKPFFEGISKVEAVNDKTVRFTLKDTYFNNFNVIAENFIIPKSIYGNFSDSKTKHKSIVCSGPYMFSKYEKEKMIELKRFDSWYGFKDAAWKNYYNFPSIQISFVKDYNSQIEKLKNGELDYLSFSNSDRYIKKTSAADLGKEVLKLKVINKMPKDYSFIGWNMKKSIFQDKATRKALAHLFNRQEMNKKFRFNLAELVSAPIYPQSDYAPKVKPLVYDPILAKKLLTEAGWADTNHDGVLDKIIDGQKTDFKFSLAYAAKENEKYWILYKEDLKKVGIEMGLKFLDWGNYIKFLNDGNFDAVAMRWTASSIDPDPKQIWHSSSAVQGGSNYISYHNPQVDHFIDEGRMEIDRSKRLQQIQKAYELIADDAPYLFLFSEKYDFYAVSSRIQRPKDTLNYSLGIETWSIKKK